MTESWSFGYSRMLNKSVNATKVRICFGAKALYDFQTLQAIINTFFAHVANVESIANMESFRYADSVELCPATVMTCVN